MKKRLRCLDLLCRLNQARANGDDASELFAELRSFDCSRSEFMRGYWAWVDRRSPDADVSTNGGRYPGGPPRNRLLLEGEVL